MAIITKHFFEMTPTATVPRDRAAQQGRREPNTQTPASIAAAKAAQQQERRAVEMMTGLRILDCGRIVRAVAPWGYGQGFNDDPILQGLDAALRVADVITERK